MSNPGTAMDVILYALIALEESNKNCKLFLLTMQIYTWLDSHSNSQLHWSLIDNMICQWSTTTNPDILLYHFQGTNESDFPNAYLVSAIITMIKSVSTRFTLWMAGWLLNFTASKNY